MKIHHSPIPLVDRIAHVLRNDRERTAKFIADTLARTVLNTSTRG